MKLSDSISLLEEDRGTKPQLVESTANVSLLGIRSFDDSCDVLNHWPLPIPQICEIRAVLSNFEEMKTITVLLPNTATLDQACSRVRQKLLSEYERANSEVSAGRGESVSDWVVTWSKLTLRRSSL